MNGNTPPSLASRTCAQCKSSKKKCDKILPVCSRCSRLAIECLYSESEKQNEFDTGQDLADVRFNEVFRRLERIEAHVFQSSTAQDFHVDEMASGIFSNGNHRKEPGSLDNLLAIRAESHGLDKSNPQTWDIDPNITRPEYMRLTLSSSVLRALREHGTTMKMVISRYTECTAKWLPMIPQDKLEKEQALFSQLESSDMFMLQFLAMHILVTPFDEHPSAASLEQSSWYRTCKYHFTQYVAFVEPSVELIQAGMLIAVFEHVQCIGERALTTLGICARMAYSLDLDDVVARQSSKNPGNMNLDDELAVLTWWGLSRLDRYNMPRLHKYFNMPPITFPKQPCMPLQAYSDKVNNGRVYQGPPMCGFSTLEDRHLDAVINELEAARKLGRIHAFIRDNRYEPASAISDGVQLLLRELQEHFIMLRIRLRNSGSWAGLAVMLSAGLQLLCFFAEKRSTLDNETMRSFHTYITEIRDAIGQCRIINGFTENYLDGIQPSWASIPFQAISAYKSLSAADSNGMLPEIDTTICLEVLHMMAPRYKLAEKCLLLLEQL